MFKKLLAVVLVLAAMLSMAACGGTTAQDGLNAAGDALLSTNIEKSDILGVWESEAKISDVLTYTDDSQMDAGDNSSAILEVLQQVKSDETFDVSIKFNEDNTYDIIYDAESFVDAVLDYYEDVFDAMKNDKEMLKKFASLDDSTLDLLISSNGFSSFTQVVDLLAQNIKNMDKSEFLSTLTSSLVGSKLENGNIVLDGLKYEIDGKSLKIQLDKSTTDTTEMVLKNGKLSFKTLDGVFKNPNAVIFKNGFEKEDND